MAEESKDSGHSPLRDLYYFITFLVIVVILWYASGGPSRADLRGAFISGPSWDSQQANQPQQPTFSQGSVAPPPQVQY